MRTALGLAMAWLASAVGAGPIYKCEDKGAVTYTDQPCAAGATPHPLPGFVVAATPSGSQRDLAQQYDRRIAREKSARDRADAKWVKERKGLKDRAERVRNAIIDHKVIRGMTMDEVRLSLGPPDRMQKSETHGSAKETWTYTVNGATRRVNFKDGEVSTSSRREQEQTR